jgi:hypothetical protein
MVVLLFITRADGCAATPENALEKPTRRIAAIAL